MLSLCSAGGAMRAAACSSSFSRLRMLPTLDMCGCLVQIEDLTPLPSEEDPTDWKWERYRLFEDRAGNRIATYTSTYARYAASEIPKGPVTLVGVLQYGNAGSIGKSYMIKMRDENDCFR